MQKPIISKSKTAGTLLDLIKSAAISVERIIDDVNKNTRIIWQWITFVISKS